MEALPSFGKLTSQQISSDLCRSTQLSKLLELGFNIVSTATNASGVDAATKGTIVFTGKCSLSRDGMRKVAIENGFDASSNTVKKSTTYLVCGDNTGATKMEKAKALGVTLLTEAEFNKLCEA
jgi:DNA ligase (NAD+)